MEQDTRLEVREVKETKKEEPEYTPLHSSSHKNNTPKDYHVLQEKYRVANRYKNLIIGIVVVIVMWYNNWICVDRQNHACYFEFSNQAFAAQRREDCYEYPDMPLLFKAHDSRHTLRGVVPRAILSPAQRNPAG